MLPLFIYSASEPQASPQQTRPTRAEEALYTHLCTKVEQTRATISPWIHDVYEYRLENSKFVLRFASKSELAYTGLSRPNHLTFLQECLSKLGPYSIELKLDA